LTSLILLKRAVGIFASLSRCGIAFRRGKPQTFLGFVAQSTRSN
jgi:hypothetical protein